MNTEERQAFVTTEFVARFGAPPAVWGRAPGRVDLMGSHTDYNLGYVMLMAIDRDTWMAARPRADRQVRIASLNLPGVCHFSLDDIRHVEDQALAWTEYVRGMAMVLQDAGLELTGFDGLIHSTVPLGGGLSSSAALEMATAIIFQQVSGFRLDTVEMARLGQGAENQFVGVNCGILDQYSSAMGREGSALLLDCRDLTSTAVPIHSDLQVVICDTRAERRLAGTEYDERRRQCEEGARLLQRYRSDISSLRDVDRDFFEKHRQDLPEIVAKRCQFIIEENARGLELREALPRGDRQALGDLFHASFAGARDLYEIAVPAMETMVEVMLEAPGAVAARQAGAGFGGCMVALVEAQRVQQFVPWVTEAYAAQTNIRPSVYTVVAAPGAGVLHA